MLLAKDRLTAGIYQGTADEPVGKLEAALRAVTEADTIAAKLKKNKTAANPSEQAALDRADTLTRAVIAVDDFAPEDVSGLKR